MSTPGYHYLLEKGLTIETLREFAIAYRDTQGTLHGSTFPEKLKSLLTDKFNGCVLLPVHDLYGNPVSIMGRRLEGNPKFEYLVGFKAHNYLFGLHKTVGELVRNDWVVLTEGPFDMMSCYQHGIKNVVSILGTSLTHMQLCLLKRFVNKWLIVLDGDAAGQAATKQLTTLGKKYGILVKTLALPAGFDPDQFLKQEGLKGWSTLCAKQLKNIFAAPLVPTTTGTFFTPEKPRY